MRIRRGPRHCDRGASPTVRHWTSVREGRGARRTGSQETGCAAIPRGDGARTRARSARRRPIVQANQHRSREPPVAGGAVPVQCGRGIRRHEAGADPRRRRSRHRWGPAAGREGDGQVDAGPLRRRPAPRAGAVRRAAAGRHRGARRRLDRPGRGARRRARSASRPGLLAEANGGVLYVDEVNLLADHLVDVLLDSAASGRNLVERDGVSHEHAARFVLVGSMNPEEGDLRPQLLDRFGLAVEVRAPLDPEVRAEVVRRRLAFDADPAGFAEAWGERGSGAGRAPGHGPTRRARRRPAGRDQLAVRGGRRRGSAGRPRAGPRRRRPRRLGGTGRHHRRRRPPGRTARAGPPPAPPPARPTRRGPAAPRRRAGRGARTAARHRARRPDDALGPPPAGGADDDLHAPDGPTAPPRPRSTRRPRRPTRSPRCGRPGPPRPRPWPAAARR